MGLGGATAFWNRMLPSVWKYPVLLEIPTSFFVFLNCLLVFAFAVHSSICKSGTLVISMKEIQVAPHKKKMKMLRLSNIAEATP